MQGYKNGRTQQKGGQAMAKDWMSGHGRYPLIKMPPTAVDNTDSEASTDAVATDADDGDDATDATSADGAASDNMGMDDTADDMTVDTDASAGGDLTVDSDFSSVIAACEGDPTLTVQAVLEAESD